MCEGIADYLHGHPEWRISMFEDGLPDDKTLACFDGFLWCVADERTARALKATGKPVVSLFDEEAVGFMACGNNTVVTPAKFEFSEIKLREIRGITLIVW